MMDADDHEAETVGPGLQLARALRGEPQGVERAQLDQLVFDARAARALEHDEELLGPAVAVTERLAPARTQALEAEAGPRRAQRAAREARLAELAVAVLGRLVLDLAEVDVREAAAAAAHAGAAERHDVDPLGRSGEHGLDLGDLRLG